MVIKRAVLLVGHGSKLPGSDDALNQVVDALRKKEPAIFFQAAFLDVQSPRIPEGIALCLNQGADEVIVVPYFVQAGKHVVHDIPQIISEAQTRHSGKAICLGEYIGFDERIVSIVHDRIRAAQEAKG